MNGFVYLCERSQVTFNGFASESKVISHGVPRGSGHSNKQNQIKWRKALTI